jgi:hypothetical protein
LICETRSECGSWTKRDASPPFAPSATRLHQYIEGAGIADDPKALLFQNYSRATGQLTRNPLPQANAYAMIQRTTRTLGRTTTAPGAGRTTAAPRGAATHPAPRTPRAQTTAFASPGTVNVAAKVASPSPKRATYFIGFLQHFSSLQCTKPCTDPDPEILISDRMQPGYVADLETEAIDGVIVESLPNHTLSRLAR